MKGVVLLHGRGASGADMRHLLAPLGLEGAAIAAPDAPGNTWWPTSFLAPSAQMEPHVAQGLDIVEAQIGTLGLDRAEIGLIGFSQGACLALEYAARRGAGLGAVVAFSGGLVGTADEGGQDEALYGATGKAFDYRTDLAGLRLLVTCHERDPHIPLARAQRSAEVLERLGADVQAITHPGPGHQPMPDGIASARQVLQTAA